MSDTDEVTHLLRAWGKGDEAALEALTPMVYERLHELARAAFRDEHGAHTLQATAVVNEAWLKLASAQLDLQNRNHFYALAARLMRRILVNHALARKAAKRGGGQVMLTLEEGFHSAPEQNEEVLQLHEALGALAEEDPALEQVLELHYFGGYTANEIAVAQDVSQSTAKRQLRFARAWIKNHLDD